MASEQFTPLNLDENLAYEAGQTAYLDEKKSLMDNPHPTTSRLYTAWSAGYEVQRGRHETDR
jgi:hypothetical protein